jgi:hypothetical protein
MTITFSEYEDLGHVNKGAFTMKAHFDNGEEDDTLIIQRAAEGSTITYSPGSQEASMYLLDAEPDSIAAAVVSATEILSEPDSVTVGIDVAEYEPA